MYKLNQSNYVASSEYEFATDIKTKFNGLQEIHRCPGIYFLLNDDNDIIYIGSSKDPFNRINQHYTEKRIPFRYYHIEYLESINNIPNMLMLEYDYILKYYPIYNNKIEHHRWLTENQICNELKNNYGFKIITQKIKFLIFNNLPYTIINGKILFDMYEILSYIYDENGEIKYEEYQD